MTAYVRARRHAWRMLLALGAAIAFVLAIDRFYGHSTIAFGIAIVGLVLANGPMLRLNCPQCGKNLFFRGMFVVPWPNRTCGRCGLELDRDDPQLR
ncbi:hypothetical protein [Erythrobacter sp. JK5]|uniref:hypothetical protein n=1 Tax=Erythrobacter sp. JK5 TaxID=2829500 RepID=UPI001BAD81FB|nr:hypothetical protein [Erythrobacter sp. JK5]QUL38518.1 hypothetical protein KDC96_03705 [Erythrobacter sp. JK5]